MTTVSRSGGGNFAAGPARAPPGREAKAVQPAEGNFKHRPGRARVAGRKADISAAGALNLKFN